MTGSTTYDARLSESRESMVAALLAWDEVPTEERRAKRAVAAEGPLADCLGIPTATLRELIAGKRRDGLDILQSVEAVIEGVLR